MKRHYDYLIVGSGLFGSVVARELTDSDKSCLVIEKRNHVGGNIYTENIDGITIHKYGAHIFHTNNKSTWDYVNKYANFNNFINSPIARYDNKYYSLPFNMNTFYQMWGVSDPNEAKKIIDKQRKEITHDPINLEEKAISMIGRDIYEKLIKGYTEKQWGRDCKELPTFIINRLPLRFTFDNNYFNCKYQGIPEDGYTTLINNLLNKIDVITGVDYFNDIEYFNSISDKIIYTGPIDMYFNYCRGILNYRSLKFENKTITNTDNFQGNAVINFTDNKTPYTRIIEHKWFEPNKEYTNKLTIITKEYPVEWSIENKELEPYYPINDERNSKMYNEYKNLANNERNVIFGGRLGTYSYLDMDKIIELAINICKGEN